MGRGRSSTSCPPAVLVLLLCFSHCVAAARLLPPLQQPAVVVPPLARLHQAETGAATASATDAGLVIQQGGEATGNGDDELSSVAEMMGAEEMAVCEEDNDDECMQRRLLGDAHLDYIYTQHKGKP